MLNFHLRTLKGEKIRKAEATYRKTPNHTL